MKSMYEVCMPVVAAAFAFATVTAFAQSSPEVQQDRAQLKADEAALQRQIKQLAADEAKLKANKASGKMSALSKDEYAVYRAEQSLKGGKEVTADDKAVAMQIQADKAALQRQLKRLAIAEAQLKAAKGAGKMSAESKDSKAVADDKQVVKGAREVIAAGKPGSLQMAADKATLQRALARLEVDEAKLKADKAAGKTSAESQDSYKVYQARRAVKGGKENLEDAEATTLQMASDKASLQRQFKRLELAEARKAANDTSGKMASESKDSMKVHKSQQAVDATKKQIAIDKADLKADQKK